MKTRLHILNELMTRDSRDLLLRIKMAKADEMTKRLLPVLVEAYRMACERELKEALR